VEGLLSASDLADEGGCVVETDAREGLAGGGIGDSDGAGRVWRTEPRITIHAEGSEETFKHGRC
jgi:hypothetical protein